MPDRLAQIARCMDELHSLRGALIAAMHEPVHAWDRREINGIGLGIRDWSEELRRLLHE